jgi:hypothetical protein
LKSRKAYIPAGYLGTKRMGELAELGFMYRAVTYGIGVAKPFGDSFPYDVLTQHGKRLLRICFWVAQRFSAAVVAGVKIWALASEGLVSSVAKAIQFFS